MAVIFGSNGNDLINGTGQADLIFGQNGNDRLFGNGGNDTLLGGNGNDILNGGVGDDILVGQNDNDSLIGAAGNDVLFGGLGRDTLTGGAGNDVLIGDFGNDTLTGGGGRDIFAFNTPTEGRDTITDFIAADDTIGVSASGFGGGLRAGATIQAGQFHLGTAAADRDDRFIYNRSTGALFFDVDGTGSARQVQIATLATSPLISSADIFVAS